MIKWSKVEGEDRMRGQYDNEVTRRALDEWRNKITLGVAFSLVVGVTYGFHSARHQAPDALRSFLEAATASATTTATGSAAGTGSNNTPSAKGSTPTGITNIN
jgi:hypothetical protein